MKTNKIEEKIVFSNDIERILKGNNALNFNYEENGILIPNDLYELRKDFKKDVNNIFDDSVLIIEEKDMLEGMYESIIDVVGRYPHNYIR